jgi:arginase
MSKIIIPAPFAMSTYGQNPADSYKNILNVRMANPIQSEVYSSNQFHRLCEIRSPIAYSVLPNDMEQEGMFIRSAADMQTNLAHELGTKFSTTNEYLIIGGDHTISIGTGLGLSQHIDMSEVGLLYIDAHGDCNTPETSQSKCITGYPVAVCCGYGSDILVKPFEDNTLKHVSYIGIRDIDELEHGVLKTIQAQSSSILDVEHDGMRVCIDKSLEHLKDCKYLWLSIDIDSLDPIYLKPGETDVPVPAGLTPRELLYITHRVKQTGKLLVTELTQLNNLHHLSDATILASRMGELALGLGNFRYGL